jgi:hypothetical protein
MPTGSTKSDKSKRSVLDNLKAEEALNVLHRLLATHPNLKKEVESIARSLLGEVSFEETADEVQEAISALDMDGLNGRAGRHEHSYVEPSEAAWEILEEAVEPFTADIKRRIELGLEADALEICKGTVLGLYRVDHTGGGPVAEWAPDFPSEAAGDAIDAWLLPGPRKKTDRIGPKTKDRKRLAFPQEFVNREVPEWREMIERILKRRPKFRSYEAR